MNLLKLIGIRISNFLSIKDEILIPVQKYENSYTTIFVGKNDSGKSNLLKALSFLESDKKSIKYLDYCHKEFKNNNDTSVNICYDFKITDIKEFLKEFKLEEIIPSSFESNIQEIIATKHLYFKKDSTVVSSSISFKTKINEECKSFELHKENNRPLKITIKGLTLSGQDEISTITAKDLDVLFNQNITNIDFYIPKVITWKADDKHLIFNDNPKLQLSTFASDPNSLIPLKNMFYIAGYNEATLPNVIKNALADVDSRSELESELSTKTSEYIKKIWGNQNIKIFVRIGDTGKCSIQVEDASSRYFDMKYKSEGFKQFVSLILSLSAENTVKKLSNALILIDEPETHLYPESIDEMRKELLNIGENNFVFISTHSPFLIDKTCSSRHWEIKKKGINTSIQQILDSVSMWDNKVLNSAFGLNIFHELLPQKIIIVEGNDDKVIIEKLLKIGKADHFAIKSAGGTPHVPSLAAMFCGEKIYPYFILDDDIEGRNVQKEVLKRECYKERIFTLKELVAHNYEKFTLEDLYPLNIVKEFYDSNRSANFSLNNTSPVLSQIYTQDRNLKNDKELCNTLKYELAKKISRKITKTTLDTEFYLLNQLLLKIKELIF